jgi:hypothetical protein
MQFARVPPELHLLPGRFGPRPRTGSALPFRQVDQLPQADFSPLLRNMSRALPLVRLRESRIAAPGTIALAVAAAVAAGPPQAFIDGTEFCHLHPAPYGSLQLTLLPEVIEGVVALGWAERHPIRALGIFQSLVLVYAPRDREELDVVFRLVEHSCRYAMGIAGATAGPGVAAFEVR